MQRRRLTAAERRLTEEQRRMVADNLGLVCDVVRKYFAGRPDHEDLVQEGVFGLARATQLYDPARGFAFSTYAARAVRSRIRRAVDGGGPIHIPTHALAAMRRGDDGPFAAAASRAMHVAPLPSFGPHEPPAGEDDVAEEAATAGRLLDHLPPRAQAIVRRRLAGETCLAIGRSLGMSKQAVQQAEQAAYARLREAWPAG